MVLTRKCLLMFGFFMAAPPTPLLAKGSWSRVGWEGCVDETVETSRHTNTEVAPPEVRTMPPLPAPKRGRRRAACVHMQQ